jgi:hypothetical protein
MPTELTMVRTAITTLTADQFRVIDRYGTSSTSDIVYRILQPPSSGAITLDGIITDRFTQLDVNRGRVQLTVDRVDSMTLGIGAHTRTIAIHVQPLTLKLVNQSTITYRQGKMYTVLNRTHLGAESNGQRKNIVYNITKAPENGTFYWVSRADVESVCLESEDKNCRLPEKKRQIYLHKSISTKVAFSTVSLH